MNTIPDILAPAGNKPSFLAAIAAGADIIYCGLKQFSARMAAINFSMDELVPLIDLAHAKGIKVFIAFNILLKQDELAEAARSLTLLQERVRPDGLIIQDLAVAELMRQIGLNFDLHLSTLTNVSLPASLHLFRKLKITRVVLPREMNIDEIKAMAQACPPDLGLEIFVHGALCYSISGRCYWSSYLGGRSGLRGRCVQPCRRIYSQENKKGRFFSCLDLSLDVLAKTLRTIPQVATWKIEGRKKGPHYVYYTTTAYKLLRDQGHDPAMKKTAVKFLEQALGRKGTHYNFLPQRPWNPLPQDDMTGSGYYMGTLKGSKPFLSPKDPLLAGDMLRLGYEDQTWHQTLRISRFVPAKGHLYIKGQPPKGTSVFLIDRCEPALKKMIGKLETELDAFQGKSSTIQNLRPYKKSYRTYGRSSDQANNLSVFRKPPKNFINDTGLWLTRANIRKIPKPAIAKVWWWTPPVIWPGQEIDFKNLILDIRKLGAHRLVLNSIWQMGLMEKSTQLTKMDIWAGPFCNIANSGAVQFLKLMGFSGVIVSPELAGRDYLDLPGSSPLALGIVTAGFWPLAITRIRPRSINPEELFSSPKKEGAWFKNHGEHIWIYPDWCLNLKHKNTELKKAGYKLFVELVESMPLNIKRKERPGIWNWKTDLK